MTMTKPSPLQLETIFYPTVSYKAAHIEGDDVDRQPMPVQISAFVNFRDEGPHFAYLTLEQENEEGTHPFQLDVEVFCAFYINIDVARRTYPPTDMPSYIAVNIARILYSGAREMISSTTARSPHGAASIESVLIQKSDVTVKYEGSGEEVEIMGRIFNSDDATAKVTEQPKAGPVSARSKPKALTKKKTSE